MLGIYIFLLGMICMGACVSDIVSWDIKHYPGNFFLVLPPYLTPPLLISRFSHPFHSPFSPPLPFFLATCNPHAFHFFPLRSGYAYVWESALSSIFFSSLFSHFIENVRGEWGGVVVITYRLRGLRWWLG